MTLQSKQFDDDVLSPAVPLEPPDLQQTKETVTTLHPIRLSSHPEKKNEKNYLEDDGLIELYLYK